MAIPDALRRGLVKTAVALSAAGAITAGGYAVVQPDTVPPDIQIAMVVGGYFESSNVHIGKPYRDTVGRDQPWTVCNGVTGKDVDPSRYYTKDDCYRLEVQKYRQARADARRLLVHYDDYNVWAQASWLDMIWNLGATSLRGTQTINLANAGRLDLACERMTQWVNGRVNGELKRLNGLVARRDTTFELCINGPLP